MYMQCNEAFHGCSCILKVLKGKSSKYENQKDTNQQIKRYKKTQTCWAFTRIAKATKQKLYIPHMIEGIHMVSHDKIKFYKKKSYF